MTIRSLDAATDAGQRRPRMYPHQVTEASTDQARALVRLAFAAPALMFTN
jgi:hypothetical protein